MSDEKNRRTSARILTEFPLALSDEKDGEIDVHAVAHDVSDKGFKAESRTELTQGQIVRFRLGIDASGDVIGRARVVWCRRTDISYWAGAEFLGLSRGDRRRVRRVTRPSSVDWNVIADRAIIALAATLGTLLVWSALSSTLWRGILEGLFPKILACLIAGWALCELLSRR